MSSIWWNAWGKPSQGGGFRPTLPCVSRVKPSPVPRTPAHQSADEASRLRQNVTSPGGTTAAALAVLMADEGMQPLFDRAVAAAKTRAEELAG